MRIIPTDNSILTKDRKFTFLSASAVATETTLTVESIVGFAVSQTLLIGEIGNEKTEIVNTHGTTSPTGSTVTLVAALKFAHAQGTRVYIIDWTQVEVSWSDTTTGSKTILTTIDLQPDQLETVYTDTTQVEGYYFVRFKNGSSYSSYSDAIPWEGFERNTVGQIIQYAMKRNKLETFTKFVDHDFCIEEINSCLQYIKGKKKKWTHLQEFDYDMGTTARGEYRIALPSDVWQKSHKAVLDIRIGRGSKLTYKDKREWNDLLEDVYQTTMASGASVGDTSITLTDASNFDDDGTVMIAGNLIEYDTKTGNILSGIPATGTGSVTAIISSGTNVWQGAYEEGTPEKYTIYNGYLYWWPMTGTSSPTLEIIADFWTEAPEIESDGDTLDIYRYDMLKHWVTWAIRMQLKNDGVRDFRDGDYIAFREILNDAIKGDIHGQKYKTVPGLNKITYGSIRDI
jgi:hypothetical protein